MVIALQTHACSPAKALGDSCTHCWVLKVTMWALHATITLLLHCPFHTMLQSLLSNDAEDNNKLLSSSEDYDLLLIQPQLLIHSVCSPVGNNEQAHYFLDSVHCAINNESKYNVFNAIACTNLFIPPSIVIQYYVSSMISYKLILK